MHLFKNNISISFIEGQDIVVSLLYSTQYTLHSQWVKTCDMQVTKEKREVFHISSE